MAGGKYILAFDQGTTSSRALLFDRDGRVVSTAQKEFRQIYPHPGWVEHDPREIWATQAGVAAEALTHAGVGGIDIAAIGITNQRETTIVWDRRTGEPVYNAIVWQDRRTADFCDGLRAGGHEALVSSRTGLRIDAYFSGSKVRWILDNVDGARDAAEAGHLAFGTVDSWLVWHLTGGALHATDVSNASRTMLFNIHSLEWDDELLALLGVPRSMLPDVRSSSEVYGHTATPLFSAPVPIAGIAGDQQAALFGQMCLAPGMVKNTYGTGCFMVMNTGDKPQVSSHNLLTTVAWKIGDRVDYALEGSIFIGGAVVQWLRDGLGIIRHSRDVEALATSVPDADGVVLVPAFAGLGAPHWQPRARHAVRCHARHDGRACGACGTRQHRLPDARRAARHGGGRWHAGGRAARGRRGGRERSAHAVAGGPARRGCRAAGGHRNDGRRGRLSGGAGGRLLARYRHARASVETPATLLAPFVRGRDCAGGEPLAARGTRGEVLGGRRLSKRRRQRSARPGATWRRSPAAS